MSITIMGNGGCPFSQSYRCWYVVRPQQATIPKHMEGGSKLKVCNNTKSIAMRMMADASLGDKSGECYVGTNHTNSTTQGGDSKNRNDAKPSIRGR
jgi:hypothetical protein